MSSHTKHHHARASQELAQPIGKASREDSSNGEQGCGPNLEKICDEIDKIDKILILAAEIAEKKWPKYDSKAFSKYLVDLTKAHFPHCAEHDASKSDEKARERKIERISKIITKEGDKIFHELVTKIDEVRIHVHDVQVTKAHLHKLGVQVKASIQAVSKVHTHETIDKPIHETIDDKFDEVDEIACKDYDKVSENPFDEYITDSDAETDNTYVEVDDGATQALRKLVEQVACKFIIEVVNKWEERRERKEENEKYEFNFKGFIKLFKDAANFKANFDPKSVEPTNFYTDFDFDGFVELFKDATKFKTAFDFYAAFDFDGFVELFEDEDDYVMVDRNTMMPSEISRKAAARTGTWFFFWRS